MFESKATYETCGVHDVAWNCFFCLVCVIIKNKTVIDHNIMP